MQATVTTPPHIDTYLQYCDKLAALYAHAPWDLLSPFRQQAIEAFGRTGFPTARNEEWKYTPLNGLHQNSFLPALPADEPVFNDEGVFQIPDLQANQLVFIDGVYSALHSKIIDHVDGLFLGNWSDAFFHDQYQQIIEAAFGDDSFTNAFNNLNTSLAFNGALIVIPKGVVLAHPILVLNVATKPLNINPKNIIVAHKDSKATIIEAYQYPSVGAAFFDAATQLQLHANAKVDYHKLHTGGNQQYHVGDTHAKLDRDAVLNAYAINLSGDLVRNNISVELNGSNAHADLKGLYTPFENQVIDNHVLIQHNAPNCSSNQLFKSLVNDKASGVFNGRIYVKKDAQKTNAFQSNKNILLSADANAYSKPQLEIFADDVKCSHGSTTGQLDKKALFYLISRGLDKDMAMAMLNEAFASDIINSIDNEPLRAYWVAQLSHQLSTATL